MDPRYPIGPHETTPESSEALRAEWVERIRRLPTDIENAVRDLTDSQLDTRYRDEGWTIRQVVHHLADSHLNAYCRFRLTITEDNPTIRPYDEVAWAELPDASSAPIGPSLNLIRSLHDRWCRLLDTLELSAYERTLHHPESGDLTLWGLLDTYQWHGRHHVAHVTMTRDREGW
ncbi:MAG: putative metal-dependent hydrolase [Rhodothermales bacterium]|nr:putative metal-dependent hydrolase [Rhodothermales bacterium]MBO6779677.1 putative metal-dependent hydrolase [Rhodothermales bacterium]